MRNLGAILATVDPRAEPARMQPGVVDGRAVTIQCALDRTAVVHDGGELRVVPLTEVDVDERELVWQPRPAATSQLLMALATRRARRAQRAQQQVQT